MQTFVYRQSNEVLELDIELAKYQYAANKIDKASSVLVTHSPSAHRYTQDWSLLCVHACVFYVRVSACVCACVCVDVLCVDVWCVCHVWMCDTCTTVSRKYTPPRT